MPTKSVPLSALKQNLFVRAALNQDHALYLAELMENGVKLPPIVINRDFVVIDGRHRVEAHDLNKLETIECEIRDLSDESALIAAAFQANTGGSLPPTKDDVEHTIARLLQRGETIKRIAELLALPPSLTRKLVSTVKSKEQRARLMKAVSAVADSGMTAPKAAEKFEVDLDDLKEMLSGRRRKHKGGVAEYQRILTKQYKSVGSRNAGLLRNLLAKYEDGDVSEKQVGEIFAHLGTLLKQSNRSITGWKQRFDGMNGKSSD